jgi:hypothetical protein
MPTLKEATRPPDNLSDFSPVDQPPSAARPAPTPDPNSMPNYEALSLAPAPAVLSTDIDRQRQFYRRGVSQYRISPLPLKANPQINAAARTIVNQVSTASSQGPDVESIGINKQTGSAYNVQLNDLDTLITFNNTLGGTITLPGPNVSTSAFVQVVSSSASADTGTVNMTNGTGNLVFLTVWSGRAAANTTFSVSDSNSNGWTHVYTTTDSGGAVVSEWFAQGVVAGANTITVTANHGSGGAASINIAAAEYSGIQSLGALDVFSFGGNTGVTVTTTTPFDLVIFSSASAGGTDPKTAVPPWTLRFDGSSHIDGVILIFDRVVSAPGTLINCVGVTSPDVTNGDPRALTVFKPRKLLPTGFLPGWYTFIQNTGTGTFLLQSSALIDNSLNSVSVGPGQGLLVIYDGVNWFTERGITPVIFYQTIQKAGVSLPQESKLNFSSSFTVTDNPGNGSTDVNVLPALPVVMKVNGIGVAADKQLNINGAKDFAKADGISINGTLDGG